MTTLGIFLGLAAAALQSTCYVLTRRYVLLRGSARRLLVHAHVMMGVASLFVLLIVWDPAMKQVDDYWVQALGAAGFYMLGQLFLFSTLRYADASRISPLLGLKVVMVAILWFGLGREAVGIWQWAAVGLSVAAAFVLNYSGVSLPLAAILLTLGACGSYATSDVFIVDLVRKMGEPGSFMASSRAACAAYLVCGTAATCLLPWLGTRRSADWTNAVPFTAAWYACMFCLFGCLAFAGPVLGNIVLSTRGLFSIGLGAALAAIGLLHLESHVTRDVMIRRIIAAVMMVGAIAIYGMNR